MFSGFLAVTSQPSSLLPIDEFHEWYDEEHIPLRLNHLKEFLSGARYKACCTHDDDHSASSSSLWLALYTLTSSAVLSSKPYTDLRTHRSERERDVMSRIEELTRLMGDVVGVWCPDDTRTTIPGRPPSEWVISHRLKGDGDATTAFSKEIIINSWASHLHKQSDGWARTLLVHVLESGVSRFGASVVVEESAKEIDYYVIHEFSNKAAAESCMRLVPDVPYPGIDLAERTLWKLYKAYPCLSQQLSE